MELMELPEINYCEICNNKVEEEPYKLDDMNVCHDCYICDENTTEEAD